MFCIIYVYAVAGVTFYGGLVTTDQSSPHFQKLTGGDYVRDNYMLLNFNDMPSAMVLMVQLLTVNNWQVFTEAYVDVGGPTAWLLFLSFYGVGVIAGATSVNSCSFETGLRNPLYSSTCPHAELG